MASATAETEAEIRIKDKLKEHAEKFKSELLEWKSARRDTIDKLKPIVKELHEKKLEQNKKSCYSSIGGVVGGLGMGVACLLTGPVGIGVGVVGAGVGLVGNLTKIASDNNAQKYCSEQLKKAKELIEEDLIKTRECHSAARDFQAAVAALKLEANEMNLDYLTILEVALTNEKGITFLKFSSKALKFGIVGGEIAGTTIARKLLSKVGAVFVVVDLCFDGKNIYDTINKGGLWGEAKSNLGEELEKYIDELEKSLEKAIQIQLNI